MSGYPGSNYRHGPFDAVDGGAGMMNMLDVDVDGMGQPGMVGGQSLDDIVYQNSKAMRRRSVPTHYGGNQNAYEGGDLRRISLMDFSGNMASPLNNYQFSMSAAPSMDDIMPSAGAFPMPGLSNQSRRPSNGPLALNTQMANQASLYGTMAAPGSAYGSPMPPDVSLDMDMASPYLAGDMPLSMDQTMNLTDPRISDLMPSDVMATGFTGSGYGSPMVTSPMQQDFPSAIQQQPQLQSQDTSSSTTVMNDHMSTTDSKRPTPTSRTSSHSTSQPAPPPSERIPAEMSSGKPVQDQQTGPDYLPDAPPQIHQSQQAAAQKQFGWQVPPGGFPSTMTGGKPHMETHYKNVYSSTGFDMLTVLMKVVTRPNPEINIGAVDLSCAFVVCDAQQDDQPIVYCSENFERLTGYTKHMILGRNCRFLQSPDGKVEPGIKRKYVDDDSILYLKNMIAQRKEAQISLINYRRGGQPFMNLLTMIPVTWDTDQVKFIVGFQVDLVEQPHSMTNKNPDGSYAVNYQRAAQMPAYVTPTPETSSQLDLGPGQTVQRDDVSALLLTYGTTDSEISRRMWDRVLLDNTDDVIHVLSLKGLFMYLSPSTRKILEYDPTELTGTALSSVCHPSDIVPVTRELKDTGSGNIVNIVFRIRRKHSGYMWFECHGALHTEQGKGRKCIILVGRERPVYTLLRHNIEANGGIGDNELWSKLSTSGMFLFVSSNVRALLDRQPDEMVGMSIQSLMRQDSKAEFARILELARVGKKASVKHEMINKRGQSMQAFTTIYPGDAVEGQKPTFLVAQTRMLKFSRGASNNNIRPQILSKAKHPSDESNRSAGSATTLSLHQGSATPGSGISGSHFVSTEGAAPTFSGHSGLPIGRQDASLASDENMFDELKTTRSTSWQYELRQMEKQNKILAEEVAALQQAKKKRKRKKGTGNWQKDCANCHTRSTPEWRRGPSGNRDLCNSCGLRWAKQVGKVSPRAQSHASGHSDRSKTSASPHHTKAPPLPQINEISPTPTASTKAGAMQKSAQQINANSHAAKVARMEVASSEGLAGGIPTKIDEVTEPPD